MTSRDFVYWLQGFFELTGDQPVTLAPDVVKVIRNHLALVFIHEIDAPDPTGELQATHDGKKLLTEEDAKQMLKELETRIDGKPAKRPTVYRC